MMRAVTTPSTGQGGPPPGGPPCSRCGRPLGAAWLEATDGRVYGGVECTGVCPYTDRPLDAPFFRRRPQPSPPVLIAAPKIF